VRAAATLTVLGLDGWRLITTDDPAEAVALQALAEETAKVTRMRDKALASEIANAVGKLFG
jgi:hypothetical protein